MLEHCAKGNLGVSMTLLGCTLEQLTAFRCLLLELGREVRPPRPALLDRPFDLHTLLPGLVEQLPTVAANNTTVFVVASGQGQLVALPVDPGRDPMYSRYIHDDAPLHHQCIVNSSQQMNQWQYWLLSA